MPVHPKVKAATLGGALVTLTLALVNAHPSPEVEGALITVSCAVLGWLRKG